MVKTIHVDEETHKELTMIKLTMKDKTIGQTIKRIIKNQKVKV
jgi:hypothetical protein